MTGEPRTWTQKLHHYWIILPLVLILFVLLHAGRGGGLSDMFGGAAGGAMAGSTVVEKNLDRLTLFVTGIWLVSIVGVALLIKYS